MNVAYCTRSTLRETYAAVIGLPAPVTPSEFGSLRTRFEREWPEHQFSSLQMLLPPAPPPALDLEQEVPPFWFGQLAKNHGRWVGRWGHRTIGLHRVIAEGEQYRTFSHTMRPTLESWLQAAREAYAFAAVDPPVATVVFGYVNAFDLTPGDGDLSEWFRFNFAIDAAGTNAGLSEIAVGARIPRPEHRARANVSLTAQQAEDLVRVSVHTLVERDLPDGTLFSAAGVLLDEIEHAKVLAKDTFFSFATNRTLEYMGATDAEPEA
jgi:hypothetical protein